MSRFGEDALGGHLLCVLLEALDAEELGTDGLFGVRQGMTEMADEVEDTCRF